jgi:hypothetical protein
MWTFSKQSWERQMGWHRWVMSHCMI